MKKVLLTLTMLLFAFTGVMRASAEQGNVRADQVIEQGFEDGMGDWTMNHCHSSSGPTSSYEGNTGNYAFRFYYTANYPQYLISPELDDNDGVNFTFYAARYSSSYPETFKVGYSSTTNDPTEFTWGSEVTCTTMYGAGAYQEYSYDFPAGTKYVSIACTSNDQFYLFVDDITVTATEPAPTPGGIVEVTIGDPTSTTTNAYLPGYTLYDYSISQQIYTADEIGVAGTINTLTVWLKNSSSHARNINVYMKEVEATEFASNTAWESFTASDMVASFTMPNDNSTPIEVALPLSTPFEYSGNDNLMICFQDVTGSWSSGLGGVEMDATGNQALYAYRDGTIYDPSNVGVTGTLLSKKNVIRLSIMTSGGGAQTAFSTTPDVLDLGYRPNGAWMAPYVFNMKSNVGAVTVNALDFSGNYFTYNAELPATVSGNNPLEVAVSTGTAEAGEVNSTITVLYSGNNRDAEQLTIKATAYDPVEGDVWENAIEVPAMEPRTPYETELPEMLYKNYDLPDGTEYTDAVYKMTFDQDVLLFAGASSDNASAFLYTENFEGEGGPMADNNYEYNGPQVNPGPTALWFSYPYTGTNTWYGTSAGGGFYFGYKISTALIAANDLAGLTITTVEAAAREAYPYECYIFEGGDTPDDGELIGYGEILNTTALYFFDINLEVPAYISGNDDIWVIFYSDSPYAAYCGRYPVSTADGKIWTYNPNASSPAWSSNTNYTPVIYARMLELPTGREVTMDLASMTMPKGNGVVSEVAEAEGEVMNVAKANMRNRNEVVIGDGTGTTYYFPIDNYFNYSVTEQIYTAAEIGTAGTINAVSFYYNYGTAYTANNVTMYMKNVARSEFASTADCEPLSASDVVWSGAIAPTEAGWYTFTLNTPFEYDGTSNLLVAFYDGTSGYPGTSYTWSQTSTGDTYMALRYYSDSTNPDPYNLASYTGSKSWYTYRGNIKIDITPGGGGGGDEPGGDEPWAPDFEAQINGMYVPAGTYYAVFASDVPRDVVDIAYAEVPTPDTAIIVAPTAGEEYVTAPYLAEWILGDYTVEMQVLVGTQYPPQTALIDWTSELVESAFITDLEPNKNYFMQVNARNAAGTTYGEVIGFSTPIDPVVGFEVADDELYPGDAAVFTWEANSRALRGYNLYMDGVLVNEAPIVGTTYSVEGLEYNMDGYDFQIAAVYNAGESALSEAITVYMTGYGNVSGTAYEQDGETVIEGATIIFRGLDEYINVQEFTFTTDANGQYEGQVYAGIYDVYGTKDGYQECPGDEDVEVAYNETVDSLDVLITEFYYPLGQIRATEEENDVLVEWSWTPAEYLVDFETGDFSQAEFTLPATYPWEITTTNPYEGTYCMKSACEGLASTSSTIEITLDVPMDAKMGFWVRVSTEANYDKFHFYIDGVEQGAALSGQAPYAYKEYNVAEGTHTYKWEYAKDSSVNSNDDCVYVDNVTLYRADEPVPPTPGATTYDFEDQTMMGWTSLDANNDGYGWVSSADPGQYHNAGVTLAGTGHNASQGYVLSGSYTNSGGTALNPDNYLVAPAQISVAGDASISFWACGQDANYVAEHFGVAVSTTTATAAAFTTIQEWTMTAKGPQGPYEDAAVEVRGTRAQGNWYQFTADLSSYVGQDIWVAIRHFNCYDQFILNVDDIVVTDGSAKDMARNNRTFQSFNLYRRNNIDEESVEEPELIAEGLNADVFEYVDEEWPNLPFGEYQWGIQATYEGNQYEPETGDRDVIFTDDFEDGALTNWTTVDADGDGDTWQNATPASYGIGDAHSGTNCASSWSWNSYTMYPDNWMISPMVDGATSIQYYVATNTAYPDHYGVYASSTGTATSNFTLVFDETASSRGGNGVKSSMTQGSSREMSAWIEKNIELPAGTKYVAFRHWNSDDMNYLFIDDVTISGSSAPQPPVPPTPGPVGSGLSEILWSNMIEKDMISNVTFNLALNNGQSPAGAVITLVAADEEEEEYEMDETGTMTVEVRKGAYALAIELDGYYPVVDALVIDEDEEEFSYVLEEIIAVVENLYVSPTGWAMWEGGNGGGVTPGPGPQPGNNSFTEGFEGGLNGWNVLTVNADGGEWLHSSEQPYGHDYSELAHSGTGFAMCYSFVDYTGAFDTDSYLYTPQKYAIQDGSTLSFWADNANDSYPENFSVCVATADNPTAADFTQVWSGGAKGTGSDGAMVRHQNNRYENWRSHSIDLSAYAGQEVYIAFHDVNYDMYEIWIDDVELGIVNKGGDRAPLSYKVKLDGQFVGETEYPYFQHDVEGMEEGSTHVTAVVPVYATGMPQNAQGEILWQEYEWTYTPCDNYAGVDSHSATVNGNNVTLNWTIGDSPLPPTPPTPGQGQWYYYDNGSNDNNIGAGGAFYWAIMFPAGSYTGDYVTKVATYDAGNAGYAFTGTATIYQGGTTAPGTAVGTVNVATTGATADFIEYEFAEPVNIDDSQNLWVVFYNETSTSYCAAAYEESGAGDANARWVSLDGSSWMDLATAGVPGYGWMLRVYVAEGTRGEVHEITVPTHTCNNAGVLSAVPATRGRSVIYEPHFVTDPGAMANGADASWIKGQQGTWGPNCNNGGGYKMADDFTLDATTTITEIEVYGYQTGSTTTSTFTGLYAQIYDGAPNAGGQVVWGDAAANIMTGTSFTNCYRGSNGETTATTRPIMAVTASNLNIELPAGTYYLVWSLAGSASSGPWAAPEATPSEGNTGNGLQYTSSSGWSNLMDGGANTPYGAAFKLVGEGGNPNPNPNPGGNGDIIGVYIFRDGELIAQKGANETTYVDENVEGGYHSYCVRVVYDDYAMSCPACDEVHIQYEGVAEDNIVNAIYPNPTSSKVTIEAKDMNHITVVSTLGQVVYDADVDADQIELNLGQYNAGLYLVRVSTANGVSVKRVTVVR